ncbi:AAA family ATPase [Thiocapsa sp.]|uniref:AAA family ATPase n=1 Tax=Thiocapsa sp. TaxID=2024551 RepID=UPI002CD17778|nr:AAA family ATPase [Thiocapsa sp.]HSO83129.1 AAA family ATPase [Thiocapsa sp.]
MLQTIELIDFKNHVDTKIRLQRLTFLVGPNGAGKTGVLQGIALGAAALRDSRAIAPGGSDAALARRGSPGYRLSFAGDALPDAGNNAGPTLWVLEVSSTDAVSFRLGGRKADLGDRDGRLFADPPLLQEAKIAVGPARLLRLDAPRLAAPSFLGSVDAKLDHDGSGLASTIAHLMTYERERFSTLEQQLIELVPSVLSIRVRRVEMKRPTPGTSTTQAGRLLALLDDKEDANHEPVIGDELVLDTRSGKELPASALSEGTLILLGLLTFLTEPEPPRLLLIDDLDRSLHPRAQTQLIDLLRKTLDQHPDLQIVATSHSPYLIDELNDDEVWVLNLRDDGTAAACLADHPDAERFRGVLRTGEFLTSVGEDWVIGPVNSDKGDAHAAGTDR